MTSAELRAVRLDNLPLRELLASQRHFDDLVKELKLIAAGMASHTLEDEVPRRLVTVIEAVLDRYANARVVSRATIDQAVASGQQAVTMTVDLPTAAADDVEQLVQLMEEAEAYCRDGRLLTLPPSPEVSAFRRRLVDDLVRQLRNGPG